MLVGVQKLLENFVVSILLLPMCVQSLAWLTFLGLAATHPGDANAQEGMPISSGALALPRDREFFFTEDASSAHQINNYHSNTDISVQLERHVLLKFRDYLHRLIALGNVKGRILFSSF